MNLDAEKTDSDKTPAKNREKVGRFRRALPQILATSAKNLILLDLGMTLAFPTLVIPALLKSESDIRFDRTLASWFGSIMFICQPLGSLVSGTVLEPLGRKYSMLLVNIPHLIGWYLFYVAISVPALFVAAVLMGLGVGFMEAPVITYVGEISEPSLRGMLTSYSGLFVMLGLIVELLLGTIYGWNVAALISSFVPIITIVAISQVPETPMWLLSKNRLKEAEKSLRWLRGWVPASAVQKELEELVRYRDNSRLVLPERRREVPEATNVGGDSAAKTAYANPAVSLDDEREPRPGPNDAAAVDRKTTAGAAAVGGGPDEASVDDGRGDREGAVTTVAAAAAAMATQQLEAESVVRVQRKATLKERLRDVVRPQMRKPMMLVVAFFVFHNGSGFPAMRPYMVTVFEELRFPVDAHWATVLISCIGFVGVIVCTVSVRYVGKRKLTLTSLVGCAVSMLGLALWTLLNERSASASSPPGSRDARWTPFVLFTALSFSFSFGIAPIPWVILSEVFPYRGRGFASGVAAAISYIMGFVTSKTFLDLKSLLGLSGVFLLYGSITVGGIVYVYCKLPETEGRSLEDIENLYKSKKTKT